MVSALSTAVVMLGDPVAGLAGEVPIPHLHVPLGINLLAVAVGAIVGTLRAGESDDVDVVGMFVLALCFGFGGAIVRDLLLGHLPPAAFRNPAYITVVLAATVVGSIFLAYLDHLERPLWVLDSLSIGLFAAVGTNAALLSGLAFLPAVFIGTMASAGGGVLADVLQGRPSALLHRGPPNVLAGLAGAMAYAVSYDLLSEQVVTALAVGAALAVRLAGRRFGMTSPMPLKEHLGLRQKVVHPLGLEPSSLRENLRILWGRGGERTRRRPPSPDLRDPRGGTQHRSGAGGGAQHRSGAGGGAQHRSEPRRPTRTRIRR
jgi:uncharacterized membrane protein YeiH